MSGASSFLYHYVFLHVTKDLSAPESMKAELFLSYWKQKSLLGLFCCYLCSHTVKDPIMNHFYGTNTHKMHIENLHNFGVSFLALIFPPV